MFKFGCSVCNKTWGIGETRTCTCAPEDDDDIQQYKKPWVGLTIGEIAEVVKTLERGNFLVAIQNIESKLKDKNT